MKINKNKVLICNCENTMDIDGDKLEKACGASACTVYNNLCNQELSIVGEALKESKEKQTNLSIACTQETKTFESYAEENNFPNPKTFNIREISGWSKEGKNSIPKMSTLIKHAQEINYPTPSLNLISHGRCLVYFELKNNETELEEVKNYCEKLSAHLGVTLLITNYTPTTFEKSISYQLCKGKIISTHGYFSNFKLTIDGFSEFKPSSKSNFDFMDDADGVETDCDIIINFTNHKLINSEHRRDGYFKTNINNPKELLDIYAKVIEMIGEFEKPLYVKYDENLCAHSRNQIPGCSNCLDICPANAIKSEGNFVSIDPGICGGCGFCGSVCPSGAIETDYPPLEFILTQTKKIVENYLMAGGKNPEIILHDSDFGNEMISMLSRHFSGLPSNLIPYELHSTGRIGHDLITSLIALGYEKIYILTDPKLASEHIHIPLQLNLAKSMIKGVVKSYSEDFVKIIDNNDPEKVSEIIYKNRNGIKIKTKPFNPLGKPRGIVRVAMQSLQKESNKSNVIELPKGSPYGTLDVNLEKCTICLSCVSGCPASALQDNPDAPQLSFREDACLQCGICVSTCPEKAITLVPQYNLNDDSMAAKVIIEDTPFDCISCGKTFGSTKSIERIAKKLSNHSMFQNQKKTEILKMCEDCRVGAMFEENDKILDVGERPKPRTTDDYLN